MQVFLEILKYTLPSLIVFLTAYFLLKQVLGQQTLIKSIDQKANQDQSALQLRLQALERLTLLLDRITPYNLYLRLNSPNLSAKDLQTSMMIAIQQEFEYNLTQQLYVSSNLWKIINLAKDQTVEIISQCGDKCYNTDPSQALMEKINRVTNEIKVNPIEQAKAAIRKELSLYI